MCYMTPHAHACVVIDDAGKKSFAEAVCHDV